MGLWLHQQTHKGVKKYNCPKCNKSFTRTDLLKAHSPIHTGEKPHKCTQRNYSVNQVSNLRKHILRHNGEKPHHCNQFDYSTTDSSSLKSHKMAKHMEEKSYSCNQCEYSSTQLSNLNVHKRIHFGEKPHRCTQPVNFFLWEITFRNTLRRKHTLATNVNIQQHTPAILRCTKEPTPVKNLTDAQFVNFPPLDFCSTLISLQYKKSTTFLAKIYEKEPLWVVS